MISATLRNAPKIVGFPNGSAGSLVGHLYLPKTYNPNQRYPAVVVGGSMASVKEQMSGTYASGEPIGAPRHHRHGHRLYQLGGAERHTEAPIQKSKDLSSAVSYLTNRKDVAATALLGVCTSGGNILYAAAEDHRVRALVTVAGFFGQPELLSTLLGADGVESWKAAGRQARDLYRETGEIKTIKAYSDTEPAARKTPKDSYYMDQSQGGGVHAWRNAFAVMSWESWLTFQKAAFPAQASKVYNLLAGPKECIWTEATHFNFYDNTEMVQHAVQHIAGFLHKTLAL